MKNYDILIKKKCVSENFCLDGPLPFNSPLLLLSVKLSKSLKKLWFMWKMLFLLISRFFRLELIAHESCCSWAPINRLESLGNICSRKLKFDWEGLNRLVLRQFVAKRDWRKSWWLPHVQNYQLKSIFDHFLTLLTR